MNSEEEERKIDFRKLGVRRGWAFREEHHAMLAFNVLCHHAKYISSQELKNVSFKQHASFREGILLGYSMRGLYKNLPAMYLEMYTPTTRIAKSK